MRGQNGARDDPAESGHRTDSTDDAGVTAISFDRRPRTTLFRTFALQPAVPRKVHFSRSKSLNVDLSLPVLPQLAVVSSTPPLERAV